jgi:hypothetical protein
MNDAWPTHRWSRVVPVTVLYLATIMRTIFLIAKAPVAFCRQVMEGTPPSAIVSPKALIASLLVLVTFLSLVFSDQEKDRSWLVPLAVLQISERDSFDEVFPELSKTNVGKSFVQELVALIFYAPRGQSPTAMHLGRLLREKVNSNSLERYIASQDPELASAYHSLTWVMELGATFEGWWGTVGPLFYWYLVCLLMHLFLPVRDTPARQGIAAQQYVVFGLMLSYGLPLFVFMHCIDSVPSEKLEASTLVPVVFFASFGIYLTSVVVALRAIAKAYKYAVLVTIGIFCLIAMPIASVVTLAAEWTCRAAFMRVSQFRDPDEAAVAEALLGDTVLAIFQEQPGQQGTARHEYGLGMRFEAKPRTGAIVTALLRTGAAHLSREIKVGDTIVMCKKTPDSEWVDLKSLEYESIRALFLGQRKTETVLLVERQGEPAAREVTLKRKRLYQVSDPWLEIIH